MTNDTPKCINLTHQASSVNTVIPPKTPSIKTKINKFNAINDCLDLNPKYFIEKALIKMIKRMGFGKIFITIIVKN